MFGPLECIVCGSGPVVLDAGYYFCADCGAQQEGRETEQEFGAFGQHGKKIHKPKKDRDLEAQKKERVRRLREDPYLTERALSQEDYPFWLDQIGTRLCTATKILAKCSSVLVNEFNVPEKVQVKSKFIFYSYLRYFGIAFCKEETTDDPTKSFCPLVRHRNFEVEKKLIQNKKRATNLKKLLEKDRKDKKDAWMDLTSTNEALKKVLEEEEAEIAATLEEVQFVERMNTSLSVDAVNMAASIYLGVDLLLCILFLALNLSGCRWILLSDIFRWYREGRFNISRSQLLALNFSTFWTEDPNKINRLVGAHNAEHRFYVKNRYNIPYLAIQPVSESLRVLTFITQYIDVPRFIETLDFQKVLSRFVYNLNLPCAFLKYLITISTFLPHVNVDYGQERFSYVQPVDKGLCQHLLSLSNTGFRLKRSLGFVSFFQRVFLANKRQKCWEKVEGTEVYDRRDPLLNNSSHWHFIPLPTEVKAVALILFALKLFFGLDDQREYCIKPKQQIMEEEEINEELNFFNFAEWLAQLEMRTLCWQGIDAKIVMSNDFYFNQFERSGFQESLSIALFQRPHLGMRICTNNRFLPFQGCIPNTVRVQSQPYVFENLFPSYLSSSSADDKNLSISKEALFTPLQYQASKNKNIQNESSKVMGIDKNKKRIFFQKFYESSLDLELPSDLNSFNESQEENIILKMFPCANAYKRYPPGSHRNIALLIPEFDEKGFTNEKFSNSQVRISSLPMAPLLATKPLKMLLLSTESQFSKSFGKLLRHLALAACETDHLLFFALQMIESMFFERSNFNRIRNDLCQYGRCMFYSHLRSQSSSRELRFRYTIHLDKELNNNYNNETLPYKFCYKLTRTHERQKCTFDKKETENNCVFQRCFFYDVNPQNIVPAAPFETAGPFTFAQQKNKKLTISDSDDTDAEDSENNKNIEIGDLLSSSSSSSSDSDDDILAENIKKPTNITGKKYPLKMVSLPAPASLALCGLKYW